MGARKKTHVRTCEKCGAQFMGFKNQRYCSASCRGMTSKKPPFREEVERYMPNAEKAVMALTEEKREELWFLFASKTRAYRNYV